MQSHSATALLRRNPIFRNFILSSTISLIGSSVFDFAIPLYVAMRTQNSVISMSLAVVCLHLPHFLMAPITAFSADHFNKRRTMLFTDIGQMVCMIFLLVYELSGAEPLWPILLTAFAAKSLMLLFELVTTFQLIPSLVDPTDLNRANTWYLSFHRVIQISGPAIGGMLLSGLGMKACILFNLASFAATLFFTFRIRNLDELIDAERAKRAEPLTPVNLIRDFRSSLAFVWNSPLFRPFIALMFLWNLSSLTLHSPTLISYFTLSHEYSAASYGIVNSLFGALGFVGFLLCPHLYGRWDFARTLVAACLWQAILCSAAIACFPAPMAFAFLYALSRLAGSVLSMGTFYLRQTRVPKAKVGSVNAYLRMLFMSAAPLTAFLQGRLIETFGVGLSLVLGLLCLWGVYISARKVSNNFTEEVPSVPRAA